MSNDNQEQSRMVVQSKGSGYKWEKQFFLDVQEAIVDGWRIADNDLRADVPMRNFKGKFGKVVFYKAKSLISEGKLLDGLSIVKEEAPKPNARAAKVKDATKPKAATKKKGGKPKVESE